MAEQTQTRLITRREIEDDLISGFRMAQSPDTLRMLLHRFEIKPVKRGRNPVPPHQGAVGLYDPLVSWVVATYFAWQKPLYGRPRASEILGSAKAKPEQEQKRALDNCRDRARRMRANREDELTERLAYYLYISEPQWGMDIRLLDAAVDDLPELLDRTLDGREILSGVLSLYKRAIVERAIGQPLFHTEYVSDLVIAVPRETHIAHREVDPDTGQLLEYEAPFGGLDHYEFENLMMNAKLIE